MTVKERRRLRKRLIELMVEQSFNRGFECFVVHNRIFVYKGEKPSKEMFEIITMNAFKDLMKEEQTILNIEDLGV